MRYRVNAKTQAALRPFEYTVIVRPTGFRSTREPVPGQRNELLSLFNELMENEGRNRLICEDVIRAVREARSPLVLTERNRHLDALAAIPPDEERVPLATGKCIGEGFDDPRLDTLFVTLPVSWHGTVAQYVSRLHRLYETKREVRVYDYADLDVAMLARTAATGARTNCYGRTDTWCCASSPRTSPEISTRCWMQRCVSSHGTGRPVHGTDVVTEIEKAAPARTIQLQ